MFWLEIATCFVRHKHRCRCPPGLVVTSTATRYRKYLFFVDTYVARQCPGASLKISSGVTFTNAETL